MNDIVQKIFDEQRNNSIDTRLLILQKMLMFHIGG